MEMKKLAVLFTVVATLFTVNVSVMAKSISISSQSTEMDLPATLDWTNVSDVQLGLCFNNDSAECYGEISALSGTTKISATFTLERKNGTGWTYVRSWTASSSSKSLSFYGTCSVSSGYTYRLSVSASATRNGIIETVSTYTEANY